MNSRSVPSRSSMTSAILPRTSDIRGSTCDGERHLHASSKPSMSQKRMVQVTFPAPIVASTPEFSSRSTTHGGTYFDQDLIAERMARKASCSCASSFATCGFPMSVSMLISSSTLRISREDMAIMSSANARRGFISKEANLLIFDFSTKTKVSSRNTVAVIVTSAQRCSCCASSLMFIRPMLVTPSLVQSWAGQHACLTSRSRSFRPAISVSTRSKGSITLGGTPTGKHSPLS
mmetsp:Transcript_23874/g.68924  ORF Transcript_23874/g.68924 Transcript_23874/m.68924 type:complete len:233 (-) Transcript_23874:645-1343(-)